MCEIEWPTWNTGDTGMVGSADDKVGQMLQPQVETKSPLSGLLRGALPMGPITWLGIPLHLRAPSAGLSRQG